jgi:hypothetical protein
MMREAATLSHALGSKIWRADRADDGRTIATLSDAREVMLTIAPFAQRQAVWRYIAELLKEAAR